MFKKLSLLAIAASATLAAGATTMGWLATSPADAQTQTSLTVVEHVTNVKHVDIGKKGDSPGDMLTFRNPVYDEQDTTLVGHTQGYCVRISPQQGLSECNYTLIVDLGQISVETPSYDAADGLGSVTGGIIQYAGAGGTATSHCFVGSDKVTRCELAYFLT